jgi:hypothetical protein
MNMPTSRRRWFQFSIASLLWLMLVMALMVVIAKQHRELSVYRERELQNAKIQVLFEASRGQPLAFPPTLPTPAAATQP